MIGSGATCSSRSSSKLLRHPTALETNDPPTAGVYGAVGGIGCHGAKGDGNGPSGTFSSISARETSPWACVKFRLTQKPIPTDGDLLRRSPVGCAAQRMPAWYELPLTDRSRRHPVHQYELDGPAPTHEALCFISPRAAWRPSVTSDSRPTVSADCRSRQGGLAECKCWECHGILEGDGREGSWG